MTQGEQVPTGLVEKLTGRSRAEILDIIYRDVEIRAGRPRFKLTSMMPRTPLGPTRVPVNLDALCPDHIMTASRARVITSQNEPDHGRHWDEDDN